MTAPQEPLEQQRPGLPAPQAPLPGDPVTAAAAHDLVLAREAFAAELVRLEASARAAVDIRAKVRRNPGKTAAAVGGTAFVVLGGPRRVFRSVKHRIVGKPDPLPPSLLPDQVEKAVRALGDDGSKVRGALEREFAAFVDTNRRTDSRFLRRVLLTGGVPIASQVGSEIVKRVLAASGDDVAAREEAIRARVERRTNPTAGTPTPAAGVPTGGSALASPPADRAKPPTG
jgi:hypothetical protein